MLSPPRYPAFAEPYQVQALGFNWEHRTDRASTSILPKEGVLRPAGLKPQNKPGYTTICIKAADVRAEGSQVTWHSVHLRDKCISEPGHKSQSLSLYFPLLAGYLPSRHGGTHVLSSQDLGTGDRGNMSSRSPKFRPAWAT